MPELPELEALRIRIAPRVEGKLITAASVNPKKGHLLRYPVDNFGSIAAGLPLQLGDEGELLHVFARHPLGDDEERPLHRDAELLFGDDALHLGLHRLGCALRPALGRD